MAKRHQTALVFVERDWYNDSLRFLAGLTERRSEGTSPYQLLIAPFDRHDHTGVWLADIKNNHVPVPLQVLIPWRFVAALGLADERVSIPPGFQPGSITDLRPATD